MAPQAYAEEPPKQVTEKPKKEEAVTAQLQGLNKITAQVQKVPVKVGEFAQFGRLWIRVLTCWSSPPDQRPEHAALMDIIERTPDEGDVRRFSGWMFASSPALSALEHPVYDITLLSCDSKKKQ